jgi:gamma-glutamyltranspeptidase/glutathione hydrolase
VLNVTLDLVDHGMTIQQAIDAPLLSVTSAGGTVSCEGTADFMQPRFSIAAQDALRALQHTGLGSPGTNGCTAVIGSVQGVIIDLQTGKQYGGADQRREGTVIGLPRPQGK